MKSRSVDDARFHWFEKTMQDRRLVLSASVTNVETTIPVSDAINQSNALAVKVGDILYVEETEELMSVAANPSASTAVEVVRGFAGSTAVALNPATVGVNPNIVVIGSAYEEGSNAPPGVNFDPIEKSNRTQIFRNTLEMTRTAQKTRLRTGDQVREAKRECLEIHGTDMERAMWWGRASLTTLNGKPRHTMDGIVNYIPAVNTVTAPGVGTGADMEFLEEQFYKMFLYGSQEKMGFLGNRALLTINQILRKNANWDFSSGIKEFGMNVTKVFSPFGELVLKTHPLWNQMRGGLTGGTAYAGWESNLIVLDMANLVHVNLAGDDTMWQPDLQPNDLDGMQAGYLSETSVEVHHPLTHYRINGLVEAAVDS